MKNIVDQLMQYFGCNNQKELGNILDLSQQSISDMRQKNQIYGRRGLPILIEKKTNGAFPCWITRPDIYPPDMFSKSNKESLTDA